MCLQSQVPYSCFKRLLQTFLLKGILLSCSAFNCVCCCSNTPCYNSLREIRISSTNAPCLLDSSAEFPFLQHSFHSSTKNPLPPRTTCFLSSHHTFYLEEFPGMKKAGKWSHEEQSISSFTSFTHRLNM